MSGKRYPHILSPAKGGRNPSRIVCVDCTANMVDLDEDGSRRREELTGWRTVELLFREGRYEWHAISAGDGRQEWWRFVDTLAIQHGVTMILSYRCTRIWSLLGLWYELETGNITLEPDLGRGQAAVKSALTTLNEDKDDLLAPVSSGQLGRILTRGEGMLVVADPPCILRCKVSGLNGRLLWIDCRNWGIERPDDVAPGSGTAEWLAEIVVQLAAVYRDAGLGPLQSTAGSQALRAWRQSYYYPGVQAHCHDESLELEEAGYYGGRCEAYHIDVKEPQASMFDVRSAYAAVCATHDLPVRLMEYHLMSGDIYDDSGTLGIDCLADIDIETPEPAYPCLRDGLVIYPVGRFRTVLPGPELADALALGRVRRVYRYTRYVLRPALREFANAIYGVRWKAESEGSAEIAAVAKSLLVSIVGKLGQRRREWILAPEERSDVQWGEWIGGDATGKPIRYRSLAGIVARESVGGFTAEAVPAMAAWVTSWGRVNLLDLIRTAGWEHTIYVDTDSIVTNPVGSRRLRDSGFYGEGLLGLLQCKQAEIAFMPLGIKRYVVAARLVCSGLPKGIAVDAGDGRHYWYSQSPAAAAKRGQAAAAEQVKRKYESSGSYKHGIVQADGSVVPFTLEEW